MFSRNPYKRKAFSIISLLEKFGTTPRELELGAYQPNDSIPKRPLCSTSSILFSARKEGLSRTLICTSIDDFRKMYIFLDMRTSDQFAYTVGTILELVIHPYFAWYFLE